MYFQILGERREKLIFSILLYTFYFNQIFTFSEQKEYISKSIYAENSAFVIGQAKF